MVCLVVTNRTVASWSSTLDKELAEMQSRVPCSGKRGRAGRHLAQEDRGRTHVAFLVLTPKWCERKGSFTGSRRYQWDAVAMCNWVSVLCARVPFFGLMDALSCNLLCCLLVTIVLGTMLSPTGNLWTSEAMGICKSKLFLTLLSVDKSRCT